MLRTPVCGLLGIEVPIVQGPLGGPWQQGMRLAAAVSDAGALGSVPTTLRTPAQVRDDVRRLRDLTDRPFALNMTRRPFDPEVFGAVMAEAPPVFSFALGEPGALVARVHEAGAVFLQQVTTVEQAVRAAEAGVDVISAQGTESGGFCGDVSTMALVPQVVDAVRPLPVLASGGIADGRGIAAALALGAQGVNIGTRFLASAECEVSDDWKAAIVSAASQDAVKVTFVDQILPSPTEGGFTTVPRSLRTRFVEEGNARPEVAAAQAGALRTRVMASMRDGTAHELIPLTGQTAGLVQDIAPAAELVHRLITEAETTLRALVDLVPAKNSAGVV
ncbi:NAD(P)H-dependent flavin oxidoreductase [Streptomyces purpureus]|uniref:2-nitropropane dioxygenase n=1 Tax=Streptomyces purpureus TaxID=1951 RepID=A0A918HDC4_9ACTN|nr:nitronate monooxygenase family protein [Streptomyces purpureus]GGT53522.1 2-nitropropane dioxygenase [Streptomyces purpureus]